MKNEFKDLGSLMKKSELRNMKFDHEQRLEVHKKLNQTPKPNQRKRNFIPYFLGVVSLVILLIFWQPYLDQAIREQSPSSNTITDNYNDVSAPDISSNIEREMNVEEIVQAFENEGVYLKNMDINKYYKLHMENEYGYALENEEQLYIYAFNSISERTDAIKQLEEQTALIDTRFTPVYYSISNTLVVHMSLTETNKDIPVEEVINQLEAK